MAEPDIWFPLESVLREHQRRDSPPARVQLVYCWPLYVKGKTHEPPVTVVQQESWQYPQLLEPDIWFPLESVLREHQGRVSPPASVQPVYGWPLYVKGKTQEPPVTVVQEELVEPGQRNVLLDGVMQDDMCI